jgi:hypothetical protein
MRLRIESFLSGRSTAVLFEGQLQPRKKPRGVFDRYLDDLRTPLGLPLSIEAIYDASSDNGRLVIRSGELSLVEVAPLSRRSQLSLTLPTEEELCVTALADI